ncbi:VCBS repeat-containing protein [Fibrivirga algicola]|uniref:VCBS repeat-containing protein n=1 Tax=Fibrivirga algicola TaxID=2950420 RepID=A0ABX0QDU6_9BACT|nr:VCBS repeat-containing protein [Fibrivirga algicola]NID10601.1 VCBS repeat-containing protein [Fibrivirga algicola]
MRFPLLLAITLLLAGCRNAEPALFTALDANETHITFANTITETAEQNVLQYEYTYNGGGVAIGDLNNDGLADVYFTGNQVSNKLYLNKGKSESGKLSFENVTDTAGVAGRSGHWKTGVTMADVNGDGWLDIYVCYSALNDPAARANQLFINNAKTGVPTFTERAADYGLDAPGTFSTQASFFDYDRDGDLDMFLVNHGNMFYSPFFNTSAVRNKRHPYFGNRLYRNDGMGAGNLGREERGVPQQSNPKLQALIPQPHFTDVSEEAGIHGGSINFGLGVAVSDLTGDGWPDLYVANDYEEQDYFYVNDQHGHFIESTKESFAHMSRNTMGIDIADVNNDALPDVVTMDMLPASWERQKLLKGPDEYDKFRLMVDSGYGYQHMRNMLHLGRGAFGARPGTEGFGQRVKHSGATPSPKPPALNSLPHFAEVGQLAGISTTDWSWAALLADFDNDGRKDLYVTNGIMRDFTSLDFLKYDVEAAKQQLAAQGKSLTTDDDIKNNLPTADLIATLPSTKTDNVVFRNRDGIQFDDVTKRWGLAEGAVSTGAAYADLDNDGDLDLVVNNTNEPASVYQNNANTQTQNQHLTIRLAGEGGNRFGVGALVTVTRGDLVQTQELVPTRGFQSSMPPVLTFGLGAANSSAKTIKVQVRWPDGRLSNVPDSIQPNSILTVQQATAKQPGETDQPIPDVFFGPVSNSLIPFTHTENPYVDFKQEPLIPYQLSKQGPALASADVNGDGFVDVFVGNATGQASGLFLQQSNGQFKAAPGWNAGETGINPPADAVAALFFDADGDRDPDLYVVRGGNEYAPGSPAYQDQLFLNTNGRFALASPSTLPVETSPGSCVAAADYDRDGDLDLFVGGRAIPGQFPNPASSYLLKNNGKGQFTVAQTLTPGMVTGAVWTDVDRNNVPDLLVVGDWMPVTLFMNQNNQLTPPDPQSTGLAQTGGLWTCIVPHDLDHDGDTDFLLGNLGTNVQWKAKGDTTLTIMAADFNADGRIDPIICQRIDGTHIPLASRDELLDQINSLRKKYVRYADYAKATMETIFDAGTLAKAKELTVNTLQSSILENLGRGVFKLKPLPIDAQIAPVQGFIVQDFTGDGIDDILLAGNYFPLRVQQGRCDAGQGLLLKGTPKAGYVAVPPTHSGLYLTGDIRRLMAIPTTTGQSRRGESTPGTLLVAARNNGAVVTQRRR